MSARNTLAAKAKRRTERAERHARMVPVIARDRDRQAWGRFLAAVCPTFKRKASRHA